MSGPSPEPPVDLGARYRPARRSAVVLALAVAGALVLAGLAWLAWAVSFHSSPVVTSALVGYDVSSAHGATARFEVTRPDPAVTAQCVLRAYAADHTVVGERAVSVAPGRHGDVTVRSSVRTERRATSVELVGCTAAGQSRPQ